MIVVKDETTDCVAAQSANERAQHTNGWSSECVTTLISSDTVELCSKEIEGQHWFGCSPQSKRKERTQQFVPNHLDEWHPECQFYKSESGCKFGDKCSFAHRQVEGQPRQKPKKDGDKSAVAIWKDA